MIWSRSETWHLCLLTNRGWLDLKSCRDVTLLSVDKQGKGEFEVVQKCRIFVCWQTRGDWIWSRKENVLKKKKKKKIPLDKQGLDELEIPPETSHISWQTGDWIWSGPERNLTLLSVGLPFASFMSAFKRKLGLIISSDKWRHSNTAISALTETCTSIAFRPRCYWYLIDVLRRALWCTGVAVEVAEVDEWKYWNRTHNRIK